MLYWYRKGALQGLVVDSDSKMFHDLCIVQVNKYDHVMTSQCGYCGYPNNDSDSDDDNDNGAGDHDEETKKQQEKRQQLRNNIKNIRRQKRMQRPQQSTQQQQASNNDVKKQLSACVRCKAMYYCSKECQIHAWNEHHKYCCIPKNFDNPAIYTKEDRINFFMKALCDW